MSSIQFSSFILDTVLSVKLKYIILYYYYIHILDLVNEQVMDYSMDKKFAIDSHII